MQSNNLGECNVGFIGIARITVQTALVHNSPLNWHIGTAFIVHRTQRIHSGTRRIGDYFISCLGFLGLFL